MEQNLTFASGDRVWHVATRRRGRVVAVVQGTVLVRIYSDDKKKPAKFVEQIEGRPEDFELYKSASQTRTLRLAASQSFPSVEVALLKLIANGALMTHLDTKQLRDHPGFSTLYKRIMSMDKKIQELERLREQVSGKQ
jgi:hypothetical protein